MRDFYLIVVYNEIVNENGKNYEDFFLKKNKGAALVEYGILVGLIAVLSIVAVTTLGTTVKNTFETVATTLSDTVGGISDDEQVGGGLPTSENSEFLAINTGSSSSWTRSSDGRVFESDTYMATGSVTTQPTSLDYDGVDGYVPEIEELYTTVSFGNNLMYEIPVANGSYDVTLHFAEGFWGQPGGLAGGAGSRVFDGYAEGIQILNDYDITVESGFSGAGTNSTTEETFTVNVSDGVLSLQFLAVSDNAILSGIEIDMN